MTFPLSEWIDRHDGVPHNLGRSGMAGELRIARRFLQSRTPGTEGELRREIARLHRIGPERAFLTHGATEGNALVMWYVARWARRRRAAVPRFRVALPEYPPLFDVARAAGFRRVPSARRADLVILSDPNNPRGARLSPAEFELRHRDADHVLVDETYREFTTAPTRTPRDSGPVWVTGTFTKTHGADSIRVGWIIAPAEEAFEFGRFHGLVADGIPSGSVSAALALMHHRTPILAEVRGIFERNLRALRESNRTVPRLSAPLWFDRGILDDWGDRFAERALRSGVLVCPGSFFGDPSGVRVCLTRRSFAESLRAYLRVRRRPDWSSTEGSRIRPGPRPS